MNNTFPLKLLLAGLAATALLAMTGCSTGDSDRDAAPTASTPEQAAEASAPAVGGDITLGYVEWDSCVASTSVVAVALEDAGYTVKMMSVSGAMMYAGLASSDLDAIVCAWLPTTHQDYYAKTKDSLDTLGANMKEAKLGLAVPDYVEIKSIPELADPQIAKQFENRIIGIDPGAGIMRLTHEVIKHYKLPETLVEGSDATMVGVLQDAIRQNKPVVVTSWTPHWMWAAWELRYLDDPDGVYGEPDDILTLARKGLQQEMPEAYGILGAFYLSGEDRGALMAASREAGANPKAVARKWVDENPEKVSQWLKQP